MHTVVNSNEAWEGLLIDKTVLDPSLFLFRYRIEGSRLFTFQPGQYVVISMPGEGSEIVERPFSIASIPENKNSLELIVKLHASGSSSAFFLTQELGSKIRFKGPRGTYAFLPTNQPVVFIATHSGIAPFRSMIADVIAKKLAPAGVRLIYLVPTTEHNALLNEFCDFATRHPSFQPMFSTQSILEALEATELSAREEWYVCGGTDFIGTVTEFLSEKGVPAEQIHYEKY